MTTMLSRRTPEGVRGSAYEETIDRQVDLIVVGLGTAGAVAAMTAARSGLSVIGIEQMSGMGGTGTLGAVLQYYFGQSGGVCEAIDREVLEQEREEKDYTPYIGINGELKQYALERETVRAGGELWYDSVLTGVLMTGNRVTGIQWLTPDGLRLAGAKIVLDCTGDAQVCAAAGAKLHGGRSMDGQNQPYSNVFVYMDRGRVRGGYTDSGYVDPLDTDSVSRAVIESSLRGTHLRERYTEEARLLAFAPLLGVREGRFIDGDKRVTLERFLNDEFESDPILFAYSNIDNHSKDVAFESGPQQDWSVACSLWGLNFYVPIPYEALIPRGMEGLLAAGRCLSVDHDIASCVRMKRDMQKCGEAAAVAAELAIRQEAPLREIDRQELKRRLQESGCLTFPGTRFKDTLSHEDELNPSIQWLEEEMDIRFGLSGDKPGIAIWSAKRLGKRLQSRLREWMETGETEHLRKHSAFALALIGDLSSAETLVRTVRERDPYVPRTSRKYNMIRGYAAIYLLGRLKAAEAVPALIEVLLHPWVRSSDIRNKEFVADDEELRFQYVSFAATALVGIGTEHASERQTIHEAWSRWLAADNEPLVIKLKGGSDIHQNMSGKIKQMIREASRAWGYCDTIN